MKQLTVFAIIGLLAFGGCASDDSTSSTGGQGTMQVKMVDAPASAYDSIIVTVKEVSVHNNVAGEGWITLSSGTRSYDLLKLVNGTEVLIGDAKLSAGIYSQLRMTLADSCFVYAGGVKLMLTVPSSEIKLNINAEIMANVTTTMVLDFDAGRSLVMTGAGLVMKPVIKVLTTSSAGYIQGSVNVRSSVAAYGNGDTLGTLTGVNNSFKIMYAKPGTYTVTIFSGDALFYDSTLTSVSVVSGQTTNVGVINLRAKL
jgi:major membrane immunogen (membrane-anchored lipoprotein)